jgi:hypothetical protein
VPQQELSPAMAARYGVGPTSRPLIAVITLLAVGFLALLGFITWRLATPPVQVKLLTFRVVDDSRADVTFEVRRDTLTDTVCVIRAQDTRHTDVGYATVRITRGRDYVQPTYPLATRARATTVEVLGCEPNEAPRVDPPQFPPGTTNPPQVGTLDGS